MQVQAFLLPEIVNMGYIILLSYYDYHHHHHLCIFFGRTHYISTDSVYANFVKHNLEVSHAAAMFIILYLQAIFHSGFVSVVIMFPYKISHVSVRFAIAINPKKIAFM